MTCDYCGSPVDREGGCVALHCGSRLDAALLGAVDASPARPSNRDRRVRWRFSPGDVAPDTAAIIRDVFARRGVDVLPYRPDGEGPAEELQRGLLRGVTRHGQAHVVASGVVDGHLVLAHETMRGRK